MSKDLMFEIVENIKEVADGLREMGSSATPFERGLLLGYADALRIIQGAYAGYDLKEIGLDIDIEREYLSYRTED